MSTKADNINRVYYHTPDRRPRYHYTPRRNWMSDPNGLIWHQGEYHYFYQHDVYNNVFSNMSWGHAVSKDLIHWEELPTAITPTEDGLGMIFSGGTIIDKEGRAGFGSDTMLALYTSPTPRQQQSMAYSRDNGRSWSKYKGNPVIVNEETSGIGEDFRDPKLMWHGASNQWIMSVSARDHIEFWSSKDLIAWVKESDFGIGYGAHEHSGNGSWECPDLVQIAVEGDPEHKVWVLIVSMNQGGPNGECGTQYFIGDFKLLDGKWTFESQHKEVRWLDYGPDNYAGVTFTHLADRPVLMSWLSNWQYAQDIPTGPWRGVASVPRLLRVRPTSNGLRLTNEPIREIREMKDALLMSLDSFNANVGMAFEDLSSSRLILSAKPLKSDFEVVFKNGLQEEIAIGYDAADHCIYFDRTKSGEVAFKDNFADRVFKVQVEDAFEEMQLEILIDTMTVEIFVNGGRYTMSGLVFPTEPYNHLEIKTDGEVTDCQLHTMEHVVEADVLLSDENTYS